MPDVTGNDRQLVESMFGQRALSGMVLTADRITDLKLLDLGLTGCFQDSLLAFCARIVHTLL